MIFFHNFWFLGQSRYRNKSTSRFVLLLLVSENIVQTNGKINFHYLSDGSVCFLIEVLENNKDSYQEKIISTLY